MRGRFLRKILDGCQRYGPSILSGTACVGVFLTAMFAAKEVPEVKKDLEERTVVPTPAQKAKLIVFGCKKTMISGAATVGLIIGAQAWNSKKQSNLIAGIAALGAAYKSLKTEATNLLGEEKVNEIEARIAGKSKDIPERPKKYRRMLLIYDNYLHRAYYTEDYYFALYKIINDLRCYHNALYEDFLAYLRPIDAYTGERLDQTMSFGNIGWNDDGYPLIEASDQYIDPNWLPLELTPNDDPELSYDFILNYGEYEPYDTLETNY